MVDSRQIERLFSAYTGSEAFLFVCYSHDDADAIYPELQWLHDQGMNVWYDEGISAGKNWRSEIGDSLLKADYFLFYISKASLRSEHCNREINLALDERKKIIPIYLENVELTSDLKVGLSRVQALFNTDKKYQQLLLNALGAQGAARAASSKPSSYMDQSIANKSPWYGTRWAAPCRRIRRSIEGRTSNREFQSHLCGVSFEWPHP